MEIENFSTFTPAKSPVLALQNSHVVFETVLNTIFPQPSEENKAIRFKQLLGEVVKSISDEQIETIITEFDYLINTWLDEFEKRVFQGMTLGEILKEKEYASAK